MRYPHLFEKGSIGRIQIRNRIVMPAMGTNFTGTDGLVCGRNIRLLPGTGARWSWTDHC